MQVQRSRAPLRQRPNVGVGGLEDVWALFRAQCWMEYDLLYKKLLAVVVSRRGALLDDVDRLVHAEILAEIDALAEAQAKMQQHVAYLYTQQDELRMRMQEMGKEFEAQSNMGLKARNSGAKHGESQAEGSPRGDERPTVGVRQRIPFGSPICARDEWGPRAVELRARASGRAVARMRRRHRGGVERVGAPRSGRSLLSAWRRPRQA